MTTADSTTDIATLEAKAARAAEAYQRAQNAAAEARRVEQARQDQRARQIDEQIVSNYDDAEMFRQVREAREELADVVAESDIGKAWIAVQLAELRHAHAAVDYNSAADRLGGVRQMPPRPAGNVNLETLSQIVDRAAADAISAELIDRDTERAAHIAATEENR